MNLFFAREANRRSEALVPPGDLADEHRRLEQLERGLRELNEELPGADPRGGTRA